MLGDYLISSTSCKNKERRCLVRSPLHLQVLPHCTVSHPSATHDKQQQVTKCINRGYFHSKWGKNFCSCGAKMRSTSRWSRTKMQTSESNGRLCLQAAWWRTLVNKEGQSGAHLAGMTCSAERMLMWLNSEPDIWWTQRQQQCLCANKRKKIHHNYTGKCKHIQHAHAIYTTHNIQLTTHTCISHTPHSIYHMSHIYHTYIIHTHHAQYSCVLVSPQRTHTKLLGVSLEMKVLCTWQSNTMEVWVPQTD